MRKPSALSTAISGILFGASVLPAGVALAQIEDNAEPIEEIITTGSRIIRTDKFDTAGHVVNVDEAAIDALAELNIADVLRASPLNAYGSFNERSGSSAQSNATFDLRGLGSQRTLVMLDGMRLPGSPALGADSVNINMLPMVAIQRMDILADGASAVYGSDAVAGVVNLVTHKQFEGIELSLRYGDRDRDDGGDTSIGLLAGAGNEKGNVVFAVEYSKRDAIFDVDREYTAPWVRDTNGDGRIDTYVDTDGISFYGRTWELYDPTTGYYELSAAADCPTTDGFMGPMGALAFGEPDGTLCTFAYAGISANRAELEKISTYMYGSYEVSENLEMYARGIFSKVDSFGRYAPPAAGWPNPPADHAHNPFDIDAMVTAGTIDPNTYELHGYYRWTNIGPRSNFVADSQWDFSAGFKGDVMDNVSFDFYAQAGRYDSKDIGNYYLSYTGLDYVLNNNLDPFSEAGAFAMRAQPTQDNFTKQDKVYGHIQFGTGDLFGAGEAIALIGAEWAHIQYQNLYDPQSEAGLIGGSSGNSSAGDREFTSAFFEWLVPVSENSEVNVAGRFDDYTDFGSAFSPTLSYNINVLDNLSLRARFGMGFKAPSLADLYGPETFSAEDAVDPVTGTSRQFDTYFNVNPNLDAEDSTTYSLGGNWEYLEGHSVDIAFYNVEVDDIITTPTAQSLLYADVAGVSFDPNGSRVVRLANGNVQEIFSYSENGGKLEVQGVDVQLHSSFDTGWGYFDADLFWSHQLEYNQNAYFRGGLQDTAGFNGQPQNRAQASLTWSLENHAVDLVANFIGEHSEQDSVDADTGVLSTSSEKLDTWTTASLAYRYDAGDWGQLKIGANNITDEDPVLDFEGKYDRDHYDLYDSLGRVWYAEYKIAFE